MTSIAHYTMASASLYLGAQADEIVASPSAAVGWVGTVMIHQEFSRAFEMEGVTTTIFRNPPGKFGANSYEPLSDQARAECQAFVDEGSSQFHNALAKARGVSVATVKSAYGKGGGMPARLALEAGLVDRVASFEDTIRRLASGKAPAPRGTAVSGGGHMLDADLVVEHLAAATLVDEARFDQPDGGELATDRSKEAAAALALARARAR